MVTKFQTLTEKRVQGHSAFEGAVYSVKQEFTHAEQYLAKHM